MSSVKLDELFSRKLQAAIPEAKLSARSEQASYEQTLCYMNNAILLQRKTVVVWWV